LVRGAHVHFTHFIQFTYTPSSHDLKQAYSRASAIEAKLNAPGFDYIIPMKLANGEISFIAVQVKNVEGSTKAEPIRLKKAFKHSNLKDHNQLWIAIYLHLGSGNTKNIITSWFKKEQRMSISVIDIDSFNWLKTLGKVCHPYIPICSSV
jgi:hypothetical protein